MVCSDLQDGDKFWRMPECYIRGSTIKYLRIPDEIIDMVKEEVLSKGRGRGGMQQNKPQGKGRGGGPGRGGGAGRGKCIKNRNETKSLNVESIRNLVTKSSLSIGLFPHINN